MEPAQTITQAVTIEGQIQDLRYPFFWVFYSRSSFNFDNSIFLESSLVMYPA